MTWAGFLKMSCSNDMQQVQNRLLHELENVHTVRVYLPFPLHFSSCNIFTVFTLLPKRVPCLVDEIDTSYFGEGVRMLPTFISSGSIYCITQVTSWQSQWVTSCAEVESLMGGLSVHQWMDVIGILGMYTVVHLNYNWQRIPITQW